MTKNEKLININCMFKYELYARFVFPPRLSYMNHVTIFIFIHLYYLFRYSYIIILLLYMISEKAKIYQ